MKSKILSTFCKNIPRLTNKLKLLQIVRSIADDNSKTSAACTNSQWNGNNLPLASPHDPHRTHCRPRQRNKLCTILVNPPRAPPHPEKYPADFVSIFFGMDPESGQLLILAEDANYPLGLWCVYWRTFMLYYSLIFLIIAIIAGVLGFGGIAGSAAWIAKILFLIFVIALIISLFSGRRPRL